MMNIVLRRSSFLASKQALSAAASSVQTLLHSQFSSAAAAAPANGGVYGEIRPSSALTSRSDLLGMGKVRDFHVKSGPLGFRASSVLRAEFAVDDYGYDEEKMGRGHNSSSSGGDEALEIAKLGIHEDIVSSLAKRGITKLFPIQKAVLQPAMEGRDMYGRARTGTGKTLAFGIPILDRIYQYNAKHGRGRNPLALVMAPTRELARQVEKEFNESAPGLDTICVYGGTPISAQIRQLDYGIDVCVGTPGRIIDLMKRGSLNLSEVQYVVLDEADQMLSVGFVDDIETIFERLPKKRQSMLFSATMPSWIRNLVQNYLKSPLTVDLVGDSDKKLADGITLYAIASDSYSRASVLGPLITEHAKGGKCIVFTDTKREADRLAYAMSRHFRCEALHGDISQSQRERTLSGFRNGHFNILVATDVAARGLDVPNVDLVIHYAIPNSPEIFVHRSGRTGRAGKTGTAILIYMEDQTRQVRMFEREIGCRFTQLPKIAADGVGMEMLNDMGGGSRFSSFGNNRDRRFGHNGFGRSGGGDYGSGRYGGNRSSGFGRSDGRGGQSGYNRSQSGFGRAGGFGQSGSSDRFGSFGDLGSGRPSRFGESGGSDRSSSFGDFGSGRSSLFGNNNSSHTSSPRGDSHSGRFGGFGGDETNSGRRQF